VSKDPHPVLRDVPTPWRSLANGANDRSDSGFTLIELLIVTLILPLVIGAVAVALISVFSLQNSVENRFSDSGDAQVVSSNFESDVQSASMITAPTPPPTNVLQSPPTGGPAPCETSAEGLSTTSYEVLGLEMGSGTNVTEVSYVEVQVSSGNKTSYSLFRNSCQGGTLATALSAGQRNITSLTLSTGLSSAIYANDQLTIGSGASTQTVVALSAAAAGSTSINVNSFTSTYSQPGGTQVMDTTASPAGTSVISRDVSPGQTACVTTTSFPTCPTTVASSSWLVAAGASITGVTLPVTEPASGYSYTLVGLPRSSSPPNQPVTVSAPTGTSCGFATAGTGTYATTLCFVDLSSYSPTAAAAPGCELMSATITLTGYILTFCLQVTGGAVVAAGAPTYPEAFLGNTLNGQSFYTNIPGKPALYQTAQGTQTNVNITNIQVADVNGNQATGWEFVTGDAETTDTSESITWTSNQVLNLLPDDPAPGSQFGNACQYAGYPNGVDLTGLGTKSVTCGADNSSAKTGTPMLWAAAPKTLSATLVGNGPQTGKEAIFIGILLP
jgi:hypothetical protein